MSIGKKIGVAITAGLVLVMLYMIIQDVSSSQEREKQAQQEKDKKEQSSQQESDEVSKEDKKLQELKEMTKTLSGESGSREYLVNCSSCHGKQGEGTTVAPAINGKSIDYILKKLDEYRSGEVKNSLMEGLLENTSDEELAKLAAEISKF